MPVDAAAISAEARSAGVRTPKLPELPPTESEEDLGAGAKPAAKTKEAPPAQQPAPGTVDDFDALAARFAALKKR